MSDNWASITFYGALGEFVFFWAATERALDLIARVLYNYCDGNKIQPKLSKGLKLKIKYIRNAANNLPEVSNIKEKLIDLADSIEKETEIRHDIIHGAIDLPSNATITLDSVFKEAPMSRFLHHSNLGDKKKFTATPEYISEQTQKIKQGPLNKAIELIEYIQKEMVPEFEKREAAKERMRLANSVGNSS